MVGLIAERGSKSLAASIAAIFGVGLLLPSAAAAIEAFDGRIQVHGFAEMQIRALDEKFEQQLDLAQWYNVLNVELEFDILPDGWGPIDLLSAYVRLEGRFDCVYSRGCGMFSSANSYGDRARRLPDRLSDGVVKDYGGVVEVGPAVAGNPHNEIIPLSAGRFSNIVTFPQIRCTMADMGNPGVSASPFPGDGTGPDTPLFPNGAPALGDDCAPGDGTFLELTKRAVVVTAADGLEAGEVIDRDPAKLAALGFTPVNGEVIDDRGLFAGLANSRGADDLPGTADDPFGYVMSDYLDFGTSSYQQRSFGSGGNTVLAPWLPKNFIGSIGALRNKANPFRGRLTPSPGGGAAGFLRYHTTDLTINDVAYPTNLFTDLLEDLGFIVQAGPVEPDFTDNPYLVPGQTDEFPAELLAFLPPNINGQLFSGLVCPPGRTNAECGITGSGVDPDAVPPAGTFGNFTLLKPPANFDPPTTRNTVILTDNENIRSANFGLTDPFGGDYSGITPCVDSNISGLQYNEQLDGTVEFPGCLPRAVANNVRVTGGTGELPLRPAPDISNLAGAGGDWDPTVAQGLYIPSAGLIKYLNSGGSDSLDMNFRQSERAWNRGASQQDTKELKEAYFDIEVLDSRLWMRLGLQQIVWGKTELFRTTDQFNPQDLALASLPNLEESRIALAAGRFVYSLYEVGPLEDVRLEFAFNFDQVQPSDLGACGEPYTLDVVCGLVFGTFAHSYLGLGVAGVNRPPSPWEDIGGLEIGGRIEWRWDRFSFALTDFYGYDDLPSIRSLMTFERNVDVETGRPLVTRFNPENERKSCGNLTPPDANGLAFHRQLSSVTVAGIGTDPACLKFGVPFANSPQNALYNHHANQTIFAWVCGVTVGIAAAIDAGACAATLFGSPQVLNSAVAIPFSELLATLTAGEYRSAQFMSTIANALSANSLNTAVPIQAINRDAGDGFITVLTGSQMECVDPTTGMVVQRNEFCGSGATNQGGINRTPVTLPIFGGNPVGNSIARLLPSGEDFQTLDSGLTPAQRALLGCGPFWGTRCDSAAALKDFDCNGIVGCQNQNGTVRTEAFGIQAIPPGFAFRKDLLDPLFPGAVGRGGGIDLLNLEGSALVQAWGGVEGTQPGYIATSMAQAPGTVNFQGGPVCTRYVPGVATPVKLPGCRGIDSYEITTTEVRFTFEENYNPAEDGCLVGPMIGDHTVVMLDSNGNDMASDPALATQVSSCFGRELPLTGDFDNIGAQSSAPSLVTESASAGNDPLALFVEANLNPCADFLVPNQPGGTDLPACQAEVARFLVKANSDSGRGNYSSGRLPGTFLRIRGASTLYHPMAGCLTEENINALLIFAPGNQARCNMLPFIPGKLEPPDAFNPADFPPGVLDLFGHGNTPRNFDDEFLAGTAQIFQNELAVVSYNFGLFLVVASGCVSSVDTTDDPECFDAARPWALDKCSFNQWYQCSAVKGFLGGLVGVQRNVVKAGGNGQYGRRTLLWHGGQEISLYYNKRNVFGFSTDFSEDNTKTSWGVEFTWFESVPFGNNNEFDGTKSVDTLNLTVSVDRPTFINFLNANRTFFFNSQWFFRYVNGHTHGHGGDEWDVLFTFAVFTGYFQDRLNPALVTVYDFNSQSGGVLTSINYRFTEAFSATMGISFFFGHTELTDMSVNPIGPPGNRAGANAYKDGTNRFIANLRKRDEAWLRLRWTF